MSDKDLYLGIYRNTYANLLYNRIFYSTVCCVLDYFALLHGVSGSHYIVDRSHLIDTVFAQTKFRKTKINRVRIATAITHMIMMGLLYEENSIIRIDAGGIEAYKSHNFHETLSNINSEIQSRRLSLTAIFVAISAIVISIFI